MSDLTVEKYERNGLEVEIYYDDMAENPLDWETADERESNVKFALKHNRYNLPFEIDDDLDEYSNWTDFAKANTSGGWVYKFVRWYEHSGIAVSLRDDEGGAVWDAGIAGVIIGQTDEDINRYFEPWKNYIEGEVYGYTITNPRTGELIDSCCGFYGADDVKQCANGEADSFEWPHEAAYAKNASVIHGGR